MALHGGNIHKIFRESGKEVLDYSANINPLGFPKSLRKNIIKNIDGLINYPDPNYIDLKESISKKINISVDNIVVGNGATELIFLAIRTLNPKNVLIVCPTFAEYERALKEVSANISYFELTKGKNEFYLDKEKFLKELRKNYDLVILCNPNNPTGTFVNKKIFSEVLEFCKNYKTKFLIDEAFIDFMKNGEKKSYKNFGDKRIIIIRAFTKFYGIPGLRLGYSIVCDKILKKNMEERKEPWTINTFASNFGEIFLKNVKYEEKTLKSLFKEKKRFYKKISKMKNIEYFKTETNFILVKLKNINGKILYEKMLDEGILIRRCDNFKFLNDSYVRFAIKDKKKNKIMLKILKKIEHYSC